MLRIRDLIEVCVDRPEDVKWRFHRTMRSMFGETCDQTLDYDWLEMPKRHDLINRIIAEKGFPNYLEIGCYENECFDAIEVENKTGVDPLSGGTIRATSDEFFENQSDQFDCIFIDGLHECRQVARDIDNALECIGDDGVIAMHDCYPRSIGEQAVPREQLIWTGDTWKAFLKTRTRPDVDAAVCRIDFGVGILLKRPNTDQLHLDIDEDFGNIGFSQLMENHEEWLRPVEFAEVLSFIDGEL